MRTLFLQNIIQEKVLLNTFKKNIFIFLPYKKLLQYLYFVLQVYAVMFEKFKFQQMVVYVFNSLSIFVTFRLLSVAKTEPAVPYSAWLPAQKLQSVSLGVHLWDQARHWGCGVSDEAMVSFAHFFQWLFCFSMKRLTNPNKITVKQFNSLILFHLLWKCKFTEKYRPVYIYKTWCTCIAPRKCL